MIKKMTKRIVILVGVLFFTFNINAQSKFGDDEQNAKKIYQCFANTISKKFF